MRGSSVLGIGTKETASEKRFVAFFNIVQSQAHNQGSVFFMDSGEGRDIVTDELDGEDVSGWLIPSKQVSAFEKQWQQGNRSIEPAFDRLYRLAKWKYEDGNITIELEFEEDAKSLTPNEFSCVFYEWKLHSSLLLDPGSSPG